MTVQLSAKYYSSFGGLTLSHSQSVLCSLLSKLVITMMLTSCGINRKRRHSRGRRQLAQLLCDYVHVLIGSNTINLWLYIYTKAIIYTKDLLIVVCEHGI